MILRCERIATLLPDDAVFADASAALPEWRKRKFDNLCFDADKRRSVAAWELLRRILAERGVRAEELEVSENACGKPVFKSSPALHFSISHAGDRVMVVVSDREVGCDVERIVPIDNEIVKASLTLSEQAHLAAFSAADQDREFIRLWTRKEAYMKAVGRGFGIEPKSISVLPDDFPSEWSFSELDFRDGYLGCVAESVCCAEL